MGGLYGLTARRQLVDDAHVQVAIERHGQCAGNGRGRHHQHVGHVVLAALAPQLGPLGHAEAVLLVDHHQSQAAELHGVFNHGVGAHENLHRAVVQPAEHLLAALALDHAREQLHAHGHLAQEVANGL